MRDINELAQEAARHHGLLLTDTLHRIGVSDGELRRMVGIGILVRLQPGVFRLAGAATSWEMSLTAVCLGRTPHAVASHRSALRLWVCGPSTMRSRPRFGTRALVVRMER